ncbi:MAG: tRNA adenosine deaminase-associated protein [Actinobacteria bacterium]|nr:tRNA adenosine deaminase-associated protein [Actinomycetota bacterium]
MTMTESATDFAVIAYREDERWDADVLPTALTEDLSGLIQALRQQPSEGDTIGFVGVGDDFFIAVRLMGAEASVFLSDVTAALEWPLAAQALRLLDIPVPDDDEDLDQVLPAGDLSIFADIGLEEWELCAIAGDLDLFPDEAVASIAGRLKFREPVERALEVALGP